MGKLDGKVALVTGSGRNIGRATVLKLAGEGADVVVNARSNQEEAEAVAEEARALGVKALPILADVRDESAETVRIVLEPKSRTVDAETMMEQLFRQTELETRVGLNMNVLDKNNTPRVMNLRDALQAFLDHRHEVLVRRSKHRLKKIEHRLEILEGYLVAYLSLNEIIKIIRN